MARRVTAEVRNAVRLRKKLRRMPDEATEQVKTAIREGAELIHFEALSRVPVDTGELAQNITFKVASDGLRADIGVRGKRAKRRAWYAIFVEFGTVHMPARPFLGPAFRARGKEIADRIDKAVDAALLRVSNGGR